MHIVYHHRTTAQDAQGIHIREIIKAFQALGHSTELVSFADRKKAKPVVTEKSGRYERLQAIKSQPFLYELAELAYNLWGFWSLCRAIQRRKPALIYERYSLFNFCGAVTAKLFRIPLVLEVNAPLAREKEYYDGKLFFRRLAYATERWICTHSAQTIVVSTPMKEILVRQGVPADHMQVISNGVNPKEIESSLGKTDVRSKYGIGDKLVLGFVGWFKPWHRLDSVIELLAQRPDWRDSVHLLLVGDGPETEPLIALADRLGVADSVSITGSVGRDEIYDHIAAFDVALQPHVTEYASPMKIFEYLALGKCVVAPDLANIREILRSGRDSLLFEAGNAEAMAAAIEKLMSSPETVRRMGQEARQTLQDRNYYWMANAQRALDLVGLGTSVVRTEEAQFS